MWIMAPLICQNFQMQLSTAENIKDKLYMVSMGVSFTCYLVNNELAEQYGVTLPAYNEDWTWAQFQEEAKKFTDAAAGTGIYFSGDSSADINCFRWASREAGGDNYTADGQLGFEEKTVVDFLDMWSALRRKEPSRMRQQLLKMVPWLWSRGYFH